MKHITWDPPEGDPIELSFGPTPDDGSPDIVEEQVSQTDVIRLRNKALKPLFAIECPDFLEWLGSLSRFGGNPIDAMELDRGIGGSFVARLFTRNCKYGISATPGDYLGAVAQERTPLAGEEWTRGRDLSDGDYSAETWHKILADIVAYELVRLGK